MPSLHPEQIVSAVVASIRESLEKHQEARWPGLGTIHVTHAPSTIKEQPDGRITIVPPSNKISFEPHVSPAKQE